MMNDKKKSTKKGKSNDNRDLDGIDLQPEDKIKYLESQTQALETQLASRSETTADALAEAESLRLQLVDTKEKNEEEKETSMDVMQSMTRQYKSMKEDLLNKINESERTIASLRDEIVLLKSKHAEEIQQKEGLLQQKDKESMKKAQDKARETDNPDAKRKLQDRIKAIRDRLRKRAQQEGALSLVTERMDIKSKKMLDQVVKATKGKIIS